MENKEKEKFTKDLKPGTLFRLIDHTGNGNGFIKYFLLKEIHKNDKWTMDFVGDLLSFMLKGFEVSSFRYAQDYTESVYGEQEKSFMEDLGYAILETNKEKATELFVSLKNKYFATRYDEDFVKYENENLFKRCAKQLEEGIL